VASSVSHALEIASLLKDTFEQTTTIVTYKNDDSHDRIEQYRSDCTEWIVSVGMVSEGADIPRLQVCCHLSNIKTELYFRQILGRILRMTSCLNQEAWLYTFAAPRLIEFAEEIERDIPDSCLYLKQTESESNHAHDNTATDSKLGLEVRKEATVAINFPVDSYGSSNTQAENHTSGVTDLSLMNFKQRVIEAFQHRR
jgi:superfamily II DNA or RNA helicase